MNKSSIPTEYKGYRFRSRLEAKWAVFFDGMEVKYLYESEGFEAGNIKYLPDFQIPTGFDFYGQDSTGDEIWIEVKPTLKIEINEKRKITEFVKHTGNQVLLLAGDPGLNTDIRYLFIDDDGNVAAKTVKFIEMESGLGLADEDFLENISDSGTKHAVSQLTETSRLLAAYKKALQKDYSQSDSYAIKTTTKRICEDCGKEFIPKLDYHMICYACYKERLDKPKEIPEISSDQKESINIKMVLLIALSSIFMIAIVAIIILQVTDNQITNNLFNKSTDPICVCTSNLYNCGDFSSQEDAQACFDYCYPDYGDVHYLDEDKDLKVCELKP